MAKGRKKTKRKPYLKDPFAGKAAGNVDKAMNSFLRKGRDGIKMPKM